MQSWHVTVQRELPGKVVVDLGYVGNRSDHLMILGDLNQARPNANGENTPLQNRRPIANYQFIQSAFDGGKGDYRALQLKVERRYSDGLYLLNSFTWSRTRDNASGHLETANGDNSRVNMANLDGEFGISGYNQPLNNTTTVVWEVPFGRDRRWGNGMNAVANAVLGGWRVTAINTMISGVPTYRPNVIGDIYAADPTALAYFNPANVVIPTDASQPFGNAERNAARGPAIYTLDMGLHKTCDRPDSQTCFEFRLEVFNLMNRTNFGAPNGNRSSTAFGTITSLATTPRQVQLGVKINF